MKAKNLVDNYRAKISLPADVLWGSFVTHSFLMNVFISNECVTNEPQRTSAGRLG